MLGSLSSSLQKAMKKLRGYGRISESNIKEALRDVRLALLEADVHYKVVKDFMAQVREKSIGKEVLDSVTPGQQVVKHVHEEMVHLLGGERHEFDFSAKPAGVLLLGLHGAGKTTTAGKLAHQWKAMGKHVLLVACDIRRPAAVDQLGILAEQVGVEMVTPNPGETVPNLGKRAWQQAVQQDVDIVLFDTGGRLQLDEELVEELRDLRGAVSPKNVVLVLDAAAGQEAVNVAATFNERVGLTGLILTKLDGDARGGAALSVHAVTGCPIHLVGVGERTEDLEAFHPDRMASRILGMGDVLSLVEKAQANVDVKQMQDMEKRLQKNSFTLDDFLVQLRQMKQMGPIENLLDMMPGAAQVPEKVKGQMTASSEKQWKKAEAVICSMTAAERKRPEILNGSRRKRIAEGSGTGVRDVNELLKNFDQAKKMAKRLKKAQKRLLRMGM